MAIFRRRGLGLLGLLAAALVFSTSNVSAHAQYASSTPAASASVPSLPASLQVTYTQELAYIAIKVTGPDGSDATTGAASFDLNERHNARVPLRNAGPGQYTVLWHNVSGDDGDPNDGQFVFTLVGPAPQATATPAPTGGGSTAAANPPAPTAAPVASPAPSADDLVTLHGDDRVSTYRKRQAIRDKYRGQIDEAVFNEGLNAGKGLESALADAMAAKQGGS
jgi:methionine-rich copper-binding protein CopC